MVKKRKNIFIFTESQRQEIEEILVKIVREIQRSLDDLRDPKKYSGKLSKDLKSKTKMAALQLMMSSLSIKHEDKHSPKEEKKRLPQEVSIKSYQMTRAFEMAEKEGYFSKIQGSKEIKRPGRHRRNENILHGRGGGRPSQSYQLAEGPYQIEEIYVKNCIKSTYT